jgi:hypothetical protein
MRNLLAGFAAAGIAAVLALGACSDDEGSTGDTNNNPGGGGSGNQGGSEGGSGNQGGGGSSGCTEITAVNMFANSGPLFWFGEPSPALGGADPDYVDLEIADTTMVGSSTFALPASVLDCGDTANCLRVAEDEGEKTTAAYYAATSGTLELTAFTSPYYITGTISDVTLVEITIDDQLNIVETPMGACVHIAAFSFDIQIPTPGWTCPPGYYDETSQGGTADCDCDCGAYDVDCDEETNPLLGCEDGQTCGMTGECEGTPTAWMCPPDQYDGGVGNGCDCGCGTTDPDCELAAEPVEGCNAEEACSDAGTCYPEAWTCEPTYYNSGIMDDCDCGCGATDLDCENQLVATCDFCDNTGSCSATVCPGTILPTDNSICM